MPDLVAAVLQGDRGARRLRQIWDDGDAVLPIDPLLPLAAVTRLVEVMCPARLVDEDGTIHDLTGSVPVEDGDALVVATSGSTGEPKGVIHTHASANASARATSTALGVDATNDRWLCALPLSHVAGLSVLIRSWWADVPCEVMEGFDPSVAEAAARDRGATLTTLVPTALARIDPSLFRRIVVGGTAPPAELPTNAVVSYGLTETGSAIAYDGVPFDDVEVRIADGLIELRGPMLLRAYRDGRDPFTADGWFCTNDAGELDDAGRLTVHGRRGDLIITGGENVWPVPVEQVIGSHPGVAEVAVVGRAHPEWGQQVVAVVVPTEGATPPSLDELRALVRERLHPYAAPRALELVEELPRTSLGKVLRASL